MTTMSEFLEEAEWANEDREYPEGFWDGLPKPILWRLLVMPVKPKEKSKGGIVIPVQAQDAQRYLNYIGRVVACGELAFKTERFEGDSHLPKLGDYVVYSRYTGQPMTYKGVKLLILNDDEVLGTVPDPEALQIHI